MYFNYINKKKTVKKKTYRSYVKKKQQEKTPLVLLKRLIKSDTENQHEPESKEETGNGLHNAA